MTGRPAGPHVDLSDDDEEEFDDSGVRDDLLKFADMVEAYAKGLGDNFGEDDTDIYCTDVTGGAVVVFETQV